MKAKKPMPAAKNPLVPGKKAAGKKPMMAKKSMPKGKGKMKMEDTPV